MTIETQCTGCGRTLRVENQHAGKQARCPECGQISVIPIVSGQIPTAIRSEASSARRWSLRTPEGQSFGPISRAELDRWLAEGRITAECELSDDAGQTWVRADAVYPQIRPIPVVNFQQSPPTSPRATNPATGAHAPRFQTYLAPHRGGVVLVLGILGFVMGCPIFSLMAWVMGSADLREMRAGRMDRSGEGLTQIGHILGAIQSLLWIGGCVILALILIFAAAAGN